MSYSSRGLNAMTYISRRFSRARVELDCYLAANKLTELTCLQQHNYQVYIPSFFTQRQGVIRGIDINESEEDLKTFMKCETKIISVRRITKRVIENDVVVFKKLGTCIIKFEGQKLPDYVYLWGTRCAVTPYIYPVIQCYKCLRLGHVSKQCKGEDRCKLCGDKHNHSQCTNREKTYCVLCKKDGHTSTDKNCPEIQKVKKIKENMAYTGRAYEDCREYLENTFTFSEVLESKSKEFPYLPPNNKNVSKHVNISQQRHKTPLPIPSIQTPYIPQDLMYNVNFNHTTPVFNHASANIPKDYLSEIKNIIIDTIQKILSETFSSSQELFAGIDIKSLVEQKLNDHNSNHGS